MTKEELIQYYVNLLILQYKSSPKARAHIEALARLAVLDKLPIDVMNAFELGQASGVQLDIIGKYVGVSRTGYTFTKQVTLNDADYLTLIKLKIVQNSSPASLSDIQDLLNNYFLGQIYVFDYGNMRMSYFLDSSVASPDLVQLFVVSGLLPKPMGVELSSTIYYPVLNGFFGFSSYEREAYNATPFNDMDDYQMEWPWLSYDYEIGSANAEDYYIAQEDSDLLLQEDGSSMIV